MRVCMPVCSMCVCVCLEFVCMLELGNITIVVLDIV